MSYGGFKILSRILMYRITNAKSGRTERVLNYGATVMGFGRHWFTYASGACPLVDALEPDVQRHLSD